MSGSLVARAQSDMPVHQVQAVISGLHTPQQALHVDDVLRGIDGVLVSRTDVRTSNLFMLVRADVQVDPGMVRAMLAPSGLTLTCWTRGPSGDAPFAALDPNECGPGPTPK